MSFFAMKGKVTSYLRRFVMAVLALQSALNNVSCLVTVMVFCMWWSLALLRARHCPAPPCLLILTYNGVFLLLYELNGFSLATTV